MKAIYNFVELKLARVSLWEERSIYTDDNADYLYTHLRLGFTFVHNPQATTQRPGKSFGFSAELLSGALLTKGKIFRLIDDTGRTVIESPAIPQQAFQENGAVRDACDCANGPNPIACDVTEVIGQKSANGYFEIEIWYNKDDFNRNFPTLSHRWTETHEIDELVYTTRRVVGEARFRKDALLRFGTVPDDYRQWLSAIIPQNFKREGIRFSQSSDGLTLYYELTDVQQPRNLTKQSGLWKFRGNYTAGHDWIANNWPSRYEQLSLEGWGGPNTQRMAIVNELVSVAAGVGFANPTVPGLYYGGAVTVDLWDRYARIDMKWSQGGAVGFLINGVAGATLLQKVQLALADQPTYTDAAQAGWGATNRGFYLGKLLAQTLTPAATRPAPPPAFTPAIHIINPQ